MFAVCPLRAAARREEKLRDGLGVEHHARPQDNLRSEEPAPRGSARTVLVELIGKRHAKEVVSEARRDLKVRPGAEGGVRGGATPGRACPKATEAITLAKSLLASAISP